jgi:hypothetical protein
MLQESVIIFTYISNVREPETFLDGASVVVAAIAESRFWAYPSSMYMRASSSIQSFSVEYMLICSVSF